MKPSAGRDADLRRENTELQVYRDIVEQANSIVLRWTLEGTITFCNVFGSRFFGYAPEELIGRNIAGTIIPEREDPGQELSALISNLRSTPEQFMATERQTMRKGGALAWVFWLTKAHFDEQGTITSILSIGNEVIARKTSEFALIREYRLFQQILDAIPIPVYYKNTSQMFIGCNLAFEEYMDIPASEIIGKFSHDLLTRKLSDIHEENDADLLATGILQTYDFSTTYPSGEERVMFFTKTVFRDDTGEIAGLVGAAVDITERKHLERQLRENESRLLAILERTPAGVFLVTAKTHTLAMINASARAMLGLAGEECIGEVCYQTICPAKRGGCPVTDSGEQIDGAEGVLLARDGREIPVIQTVASIELAGQEYLLESFFDVSVQKQAAKDLVHAEKLKAAVELAGAASHELSQPLQIIAGNAYMLSLCTGDERAEHDAAIAMINGQVRRMADILTRLLTITRYETLPYSDETAILDLRKSSE